MTLALVRTRSRCRASRCRLPAGLCRAVRPRTRSGQTPTGSTTQPVSGTVTVTPSGTQAVSNAGTFAVQDSQKVADNAGFTDGTTPVQPAGYVFDEVAGTALTENDAAAARIDSKRSQVTVLEDATTRGQRAAVSAAGRLSVDASGVAVPVTDNSGSLTVDAPVATPVFVRLSDGAAAITALPVTDNAGSLTSRRSPGRRRTRTRASRARARSVS
jgi:hypothetical protein